MPTVKDPEEKRWRRFGLGFGVNGLMSQRLGEVVAVHRIEPQPRAARFSSQVSLGAS